MYKYNKVTAPNTILNIVDCTWVRVSLTRLLLLAMWLKSSNLPIFLTPPVDQVEEVGPTRIFATPRISLRN